MQLVGAPCSFSFVCHLNFVWHNFRIRSTTPTKMYQLPSQMIVHNGFWLRLITHTNPELHFAITPHSHYLSDNEICAFGLRACVTNIKIYYRSPWLYNNLKNVGPFVGNDLSNEWHLFYTLQSKVCILWFCGFWKAAHAKSSQRRGNNILFKTKFAENRLDQKKLLIRTFFFRFFFSNFLENWFWAYFRQFQRNYDTDWTWTQGV